MNLLEHYIESVISVKDAGNLNNNSQKKFVKVKCEVNCYGKKEITTNYWTEEQWKEIKAKGYYMA